MKQLTAFGAVEARPFHPINREQDTTVGAINILRYGLRPLKEANKSSNDSAYESTKDPAGFRVNLIADECTNSSTNNCINPHQCVGERGLLFVGSTPRADISNNGDFSTTIET